MWLKKAKKKKFQIILIAAMLCFSAVIFSACIGFFLETKAYTKEYVSYENCPKVVALTNVEYSENYFDLFPTFNDVTDRIEKSRATICESSFWFDGKQIKSYLNIAYHVDNIDTFMHKLELLQGSGKAPSIGEIWINSVTADNYDISVGDYISLGENNSKSFRVGGIVATPICPSPYMGTLPYYINEKTSSLLDGTDATGYAFYANQEIETSEYKEQVPDSFLVTAANTLSADAIERSISYLASIFGGVGILAACIVFVVSIIVIRFIIVSTLSREYVEIGTYKALGFTENEIVGFYLKFFLAASAVGIVLGGALSFFITDYLCNMVLRHLGGFELTHLSLLAALLVTATLLVILTLSVLLSLRKIRKITPIEAFSINSASSKKRIEKSLIKNAYSPFCVAVNDIARKRRSSIITVAVLTVSFYMATLFLTVNYSLERMDEMTAEWFTFPQYDAVVMVNGEDCELNKFLDKNPLVKNYIYCNLDIHLSGLRSDYSVNMDDIYVEIYSRCSENALGIPLIEGRHPKGEDEIMMSYDLAKKLNLEVGEWFSLENDTYSNDYLITGVYSSMYNGGLSILMSGKEFAHFKKPDNYNELLIFLNNDASYEEIESQMLEEFPNINISKTEAFLEGSTNSINSISKPLTTLFAIIFSLFSLMNIINLLIMNNIENRRQYGILKAMGFSNGYICAKNLLQIGLLATVSAGIALALHVTVSQKIFFAVIHVNGLILNMSLALHVTAALFTAIILAAAMFTLPLRRIAPTELMEE